MTSPDPTETLRQINVAREQSYQNIALVQAQLALANDAAAAAAQNRAAVAALVQQAVTVDMTVGTRVFAGDVMIHGDTGWRNVPDLLDPANFALSDIQGYARMRRVGSRVTFSFRIKVEPTPVGSFMTTKLPVAFRPASHGLYIDHGFARNLTTMIPVGNTNTSDRLSINIALNSVIGQTFYGRAEWDAADPWPVELPGTAV